MKRNRVRLWQHLGARPKLNRTRPNYGESWPTFAGLWSAFGRMLPNSLNAANFGPSSTGHGQIWRQSANFGPTLAKLGLTSAELVRERQIWPDLGQQSSRHKMNLCRIWPRPMSTKVGRELGELGPRLASLGQVWAGSPPTISTTFRFLVAFWGPAPTTLVWGRHCGYFLWMGHWPPRQRAHLPPGGLQSLQMNNPSLAELTESAITPKAASRRTWRAYASRLERRRRAAGVVTMTPRIGVPRIP